MKKFIAMFLAVMLLAAIAIPAIAADGVHNNKPYPISWENDVKPDNFDAKDWDAVPDPMSLRGTEEEYVLWHFQTGPAGEWNGPALISFGENGPYKMEACGNGSHYAIITPPDWDITNLVWETDTVKTQLRLSHTEHYNDPVVDPYSECACEDHECHECEYEDGYEFWLYAHIDSTTGETNTIGDNWANNKGEKVFKGGNGLAYFNVRGKPEDILAAISNYNSKGPDARGEATFGIDENGKLVINLNGVSAKSVKVVVASSEAEILKYLGQGAGQWKKNSGFGVTAFGYEGGKDQNGAINTTIDMSNFLVNDMIRVCDNLIDWNTVDCPLACANPCLEIGSPDCCPGNCEVCACETDGM